MPTTSWKPLFRVNTTDGTAPDNGQYDSRIVALSDDRFLVIWSDLTNYSGLGTPDVFAQVYNALGEKSGTEFSVSTTFLDGSQQFADAVGLANGRFVAAYQTDDQAGFGTGDNISFEVYDANGNFVSVRGTGTLPPVQGSTSGVFQLGNERKPTIVAFADSSFAVFYEDDSAGNNDIRGFVVNAAGTELASFDVDNAAANATHPDAASLTNGNAVVVYESIGAASDVLFSVRTALGASVIAGTVSGDAGNQTAPVVASLANGGFVVAWQDQNGNGANDSGIKYRVYSNAGVPAALAADANVSVTAGAQSAPAVTGLADGGFLVAWLDEPSSTIRARRFDGGGAAIDTEFVMAASTSLSEPRLTTLSDGRIGVSVTNTAVGNQDVYAAIWDPRASLIQGSDRHDTLVSRLDGATLSGLGDNDTLVGMNGNDRLVGGHGADTLTGGGGDDRFVFKPGDGADTVTDFTPGAGSADKIVLAEHAGLSVFADVFAKATQVGLDTVINLGGGDTVTLQNVVRANLHADDFILDIFAAPNLAINSFGISPASGGWASQDKYPRTAADVNGDGRADIVGFGDTSTYVSLANANGTFQNPTVGLNAFGFSAAGGGWTTNDKYPRMAADVNGDGRADVVGFGDVGVYVSLGNANGTFQNPTFALNSFGFSAAGGGWTSNDKYSRTVADVNGDGRADIVGFGDTGTYVSFANANGTFQNPILGINSFGFSAAGGGWTTNDKYPRMAADVNGDGRADIVGFGDIGTYVALANANGTFQNPILAINSFGFSTAGGGWTNNNLYPRMVGDVNDDGRADVVGFGSSGLYISLGQANGTFAAPIADLLDFSASTGWTSSAVFPRMLADINGDGARDVVGFGSTGVFVSASLDFLV